MVVTEVDPQVRGYYSQASSSVSFQSLPEKAARKLPRHPVPVILLARLAVDTTAQGQGLGSFLLLDGLSRSLQIAEQLGIHAIEVDAIDESASAFYRRYGFVPLLDSPRHLYLPVNVARLALQPE